jgi:hypothetical protein
VSSTLASAPSVSPCCDFAATVDGRVYGATAAECTIASDSPGRELGLYRELYDEFVMDAERGTFLSTVQHSKFARAIPGISRCVGRGSDAIAVSRFAA